MKSCAWPSVVFAIVLALAGGALLARRPHRDAPGRRAQAAGDAAATPTPQADGDDVEESLGLERRVPVRRHRRPKPTCATCARPPATGATDYAAIAPQHDANGVITETDPAILLLSANAAFRASQAAADRARHRPPPRHRRQELRRSAEGAGGGAGDRACDDARWTRRSTTSTRSARATRWPSSAGRPPRRRAPKLAAKADETDLPAGPTLHGKPGAPPPAIDMNQFKIVIPKRGEERKDAPDAGKGGQKIRKG